MKIKNKIKYYIEWLTNVFSAGDFKPASYNLDKIYRYMIKFFDEFECYRTDRYIILFSETNKVQMLISYFDTNNILIRYSRVMITTTKGDFVFSESRPLLSTLLKFEEKLNKFYPEINYDESKLKSSMKNLNILLGFYRADETEDIDSIDVERDIFSAFLKHDRIKNLIKKHK